MLVHHFAGENDKGQPVLRKGNIVLAPGLELQMRGPIIRSERGFHGCTEIRPALVFAKGDWYNVREFPDSALLNNDPQVSAHMRVISVFNAASLLHNFM